MGPVQYRTRLRALVQGLPSHQCLGLSSLHVVPQRDRNQVNQAITEMCSFTYSEKAAPSGHTVP